MNKNVFLIYLTLGILMSPSAYGRMVEAHPNQGAQVVEKAKPAGLVDQARRWWNRTVNQATQMANDFFKSPKPEVSKVAEKKAERVEKVKELKEALPDYVQKEKGTTSRELADLESIVKATPVIVEQGKVEADPSLPKTKAGVPTASVYKEEVSKTAKGKKVVRRIHIDKIPLLRVGREPRLSRQDLSLDVKILTSEVKVAKPLKTPADLPLKERDPWLKMEVAKADSATKLDRKKYGLGDIVSHRTVDAVDPKLELNENVFAALAVQDLTPNQQKLLAAQILYDKGNKCHLAIGLLDDLRDNKFYGKQANYFLGLCAHKMGFFSESTERLLKSVRTEDPELVPEAIRVLVSDLPTEYEEEVAMTLVGLKNKSLIPKEAYDNANYIQAKGLSKKR
ncbi:MAG: hypothetical protein CL675_09660, partial [Bdellovibrionaceae bacterium]|nr:hypothetical protein [Pseudobdellovibrionaceae bacterium]